MVRRARHWQSGGGVIDVGHNETPQRLRACNMQALGGGGIAGQVNAVVIV